MSRLVTLLPLAVLAAASVVGHVPAAEDRS